MLMLGAFLTALACCKDTSGKETKRSSDLYPPSGTFQNVPTHVGFDFLARLGIKLRTPSAHPPHLIARLKPSGALRIAQMYAVALI